METDKQAYVPGDEVKVRWPGHEMRGVAYSLETWTGIDWDIRYYISAATRGHRLGDGPVWWAPSEKDYGWVDLGVAGPGPDIAVVPDTADPGIYRLCTANSPRQSCTLISVQ